MSPSSCAGRAYPLARERTPPAAPASLLGTKLRDVSLRILLPFRCATNHTLKYLLPSHPLPQAEPCRSGGRLHRRCADVATAGGKAHPFQLEIDRRVLVPVVLC